MGDCALLGLRTTTFHMAAAECIIKVVEKAEEPDKDSGVKEEDIKLNTAAMVPKAHRYVRSELDITHASRCAASRKIDIPTQCEPLIGLAARRQEQHIVPEEALHTAHEAQQQECAPKSSHSGGEREDHVREFIMEPMTWEVPAASTAWLKANTQS